MADVVNSKLLEEIEGIGRLADALVILVKTEWNNAITDEMEQGCTTVFERYKIAYKTLVVPGAVELPFAIRQCADAYNEVTAAIALGCVIRGDTPHFDYVCQSVTAGITHLNLTLTIPVIFGVLTVNTIQQAHDRLGGPHGHKGEEAAITAIKMMLLNQNLRGGLL